MKRWMNRHAHLIMAAWYVFMLAIITGFVLQQTARGADAVTVRVPDLGWQLRYELMASLERRWDIKADRYLALSAAQIHQESHWRPEAESPYAQGLTQFTPSTARWVADKFRDDLWPADPWDVLWAIEAMVLYDHWLIYKLPAAATECDAWAMTMASYNGGLGWVHRDRALCRQADPNNTTCHSAYWFGHTERFSSRADWAFRENRGYPQRILLELTPGYIHAGWDGADICHGRRSVAGRVSE